MERCWGSTESMCLFYGISVVVSVFVLASYPGVVDSNESDTKCLYSTPLSALIPSCTPVLLGPC